MPRRPSLPLVLFLGWLVPGAGHLLLGRRTQAAIFFVVITVTFAGGMALGDFTIVSPERHVYHFAAQVFNGAETLAAMFLTKDLVPWRVPRHLGVPTTDIGLLYTSVAALLNVWVVCSAWGILLKEREAKPAEAPPEAAA